MSLVCHMYVFHTLTQLVGDAAAGHHMRWLDMFVCVCASMCVCVCVFMCMLVNTSLCGGGGGGVWGPGEGVWVEGGFFMCYVWVFFFSCNC